MEFFYDKERHDIPGVLIVDIKAVGGAIDDVLHRLIELGFNAPIIILAHKHGFPEAIKIVCEYWDAGNEGIYFVCKEYDESILEAIEEAHSYYHGKAMEFDFDDAERGFSRLTLREQEVLDMVMTGKSSHEIGTELKISVKTIEAHRSNINVKMRVDSADGLLHMYLRYRSLLTVKA